jgi:hypothetical protein
MEGWIMSDIRTSSLGGIPFGNTAARPANPVVGTVYYNGQLEIIEIYNGTAWVANSAPPAVPSIVSVTDVGTGLAYNTGGTLTVVVAPGSGGSTPLQYNAVTSAGGFSTSSNSTTLSLTGLTSNTSFVVAANAQNNFGTTVNSSPSSSTLVTTVPQTPIIGTATASTSVNEVTVTWTLGNNGGKAVSAITITPYLNGTTAETSRTAETTSSTSYTFTEGQLTGGSNYTFKIKATNANGVSLESLASNSVAMPNIVLVNYLVVAGGSGGGNDWYGAGRASGGGGAGGLRSTVTATGRGGTLEAPLLLNLNTNYIVTVGGGGAGMNISDSNATAGTNSVFSTITSIGGGAAGGHTGATNTVGLSGGSGGGGGNGTAAAAGTTGQGYDSGSGATGGGGGGGAGANGSNGTGNASGGGGNGVAVSITGSSITYAGGGGGGGSSSWGVSSAGPGGLGGGGNGAVNANGSAGTVNTGGGGGGGRNTGGTGGGTGGSGIVILRYPSARNITIGVGLTGSTSTDGLFKVTSITSGSGNVSWS